MNLAVGRSLLQRAMCWSMLLFVATESVECRTIGGETPWGTWLWPRTRGSWDGMGARSEGGSV